MDVAPLHLLADGTGRKHAAICVVAALFIGEKQKQAAGKAVLVAFLLYFMNAVITHATARAHYVREKGTWPPKEPLEVVRE